MLILFLTFSVLFSALALYAGKASLRGHVYLAGFFAGILDFFYLPLKYLFCRFSDSRVLDRWMVSLKNIANRDRFDRSSTRLMFVPHCMRALDCPAYSTSNGIQCRNCGKCVLGELREQATARGYGFYIVTGSSFVERILRNNKAEGILVVACDYEINKGMRTLRGAPVAIIGIPLLNDGCFNTRADMEKVLAGMQPCGKEKECE
jgi:hypothetical protein